jgi:transketolase
MRWGIREHGMCAAMNGMALHGGVIPYGGTFMVFSDYCRPSIRLAALMQQRVIYVMTHDSIGVGEDGPTHQPVEQLAAMRAMPGLLTFRPCDPVETAEAWEIALNKKDGPSFLALTRQNVATSRSEATDKNLTAHGAYEIAKADGEAKVTFFASGSEVELAIQARELLKADGIAARVVSMPCWPLFEKQDATYRSRCARRLGPLYRPERHFHRHAQFWRERAVQGCLQAFRHHRRSRCPGSEKGIEVVKHNWVAGSHFASLVARP